MTQPKTSPTNGERFDRILQYLADSEGNDTEIAALHGITETLWQLLTPEQEHEFFERMAPLEAKAAEWADDDDNIATNAARIAFSLRPEIDLTPARLEEVGTTGGSTPGHSHTASGPDSRSPSATAVPSAAQTRPSPAPGSPRAAVEIAARCAQTPS